MTMHRFGSPLAIGVLALAVALGACSDDSGPTPPDGAVIPAAIQAQIDALFPEGTLRDSASTQVEDVLERADAGQAAEAQSRFFDFLAFGAAQAAAGALLDPNGAGAPTIEDALAVLSDDVADEAGITVPSIPSGAFAEDGAVAVLDGSGGTVVTGTGTGGVMLPAGALPGETLITIVRIPETGDPMDHDGPLPTSLPQYPRFYDISTFPPVSNLFQPGVVGLCVVDPPDPFAPTPDVAARLRIAHPTPGLPQSIRVLPLAEAAFLDCNGGNSSLSLASPGAIGGRISSFSPFAAVDPTGAAPEITSVTPNPILASSAGGSETPFMVGFADPDGDIVILRVVEVADPDDAIVGGDVPVDDLAIGTSGTFTLTASCGQTPPANCVSGTVLVDFILVDAAGNESEPFRVTIVFE
jgi:hypothetical protein